MLISFAPHTPGWLWAIIAFCALLVVGLTVAGIMAEDDYVPRKGRR